MKYIVTGSLGNISKPLTEELVKAGHEVTVISSDASKKIAIEALGAKAAVGNLFDLEFLTRTLTGADAAYLMIPPTFSTADWPAHMRKAADIYLLAVRASGVKKVVQLSSIGAHLGHSGGPINGLGYFERQLSTLEEVDVVSLRAAYFYTNFYSMVPLIGQAGIMGSNFGVASEPMVLVHPSDIAEAVAKELLSLSFTGHTQKYVSSDVRTFSEIAQVFGTAIGKPELPWVVFSDEDALQGMLHAGLPSTIAEGYLEMGKGFRELVLQQDYFNTAVKPQGKIKLEDFAKVFAASL